MIFGQDQRELRQMYSNTWKKSQAGLVLSPLEVQIAQVITDHPEYQSTIISDADHVYTPDGGKTNPYLHMGLHLTLRDQISLDQPRGIAATFVAIAAKTNEPHDAEHLALDCLAETLWEAQTHNVVPDETRYLERLKRLIS